MTKKGEKKEKIKHSVFLITISTNKPHADKNIEDKFRDSVEDIFKNNLKNILFEKRKDKTFDPQLIKNYSVKYSLERGKEKNVLHAHILIEIDHYMILGIEMTPIREYYAEMFGTNVYMYVEATGSNVKAMEEYIFKDV